MGKTLKEIASPSHIEEKLKEEFSISKAAFIGPFEGTQEDASVITYASEVELRTEAPKL